MRNSVRENRHGCARSAALIEPAVITLKLDKPDKLEWFVHQTSDQNYRTRVCTSTLRAPNDPRDRLE
jgi:hypothetical protein